MAADAPFPCDVIADILPEIADEWQRDGLRVLESALSSERLQLVLSATPQVAPVTLAGRVKGRIQHHCRRKGKPIQFSRKLSVRTIGDPTRAQVEGYIRNQAANESLADERFRELLASLIWVDPRWTFRRRPKARADATGTISIWCS